VPGTQLHRAKDTGDMTDTTDASAAIPEVPAPPAAPGPDAWVPAAPVAVDRGRLRVIVNPSAGHGRAAQVLPMVEEALRGWASEVEVSRTQDIAHVDELAAEAATAGQVAVALGGDGLVGRLAGATARAGGLLAVLPGGRGNDFARGLGLGRDPAVEAARLASAQERRVDLPEANGRPFIGIASVGFDSDVQVIANRTRWLRGQNVYTYATLRALVPWKPVHFTVTIDGGEPREVVGWTVAAANAAYYGGGMKMAPGADIADGQLEVEFIHRCSRLTLLMLFPKVFSGSHVETSYLTVLRGQRVIVDADRPFQVYADGDPIAGLPAEIVVRPGALRLLTPTD
jgi:YegS/Rv2252/BmrU family lipid kinase